MSNHESKGPHAWNRDAALERAWRETSAEQPPSHVDAAIIAAAHKSDLDSGTQPNMAPVRMRSRNWLTEWQPLAAAAVVATLAFGIVQMLPREHELAPSMQRKESTPAPASAEPQSQPQPQPQPESHAESHPEFQPQPRSSPAREASEYRQSSGALRAVGAHEDVAAPDRAPAQRALPAPPTADAPAPPTDSSAATDDVPELSASESASTAATSTSEPPPKADANPATADTAAALGRTNAGPRKAVESAAVGRSATTVAATPAPQANRSTHDNATSLDSPAWAAKVVALHASGDLAAAEHELREFRMFAADADLYLPDSLRSWARTVE
jgi:translation initiation factor IF-2